MAGRSSVAVPSLGSPRGCHFSTTGTTSLWEFLGRVPHFPLGSDHVPASHTLSPTRPSPFRHCGAGSGEVDEGWRVGGGGTGSDQGASTRVAVCTFLCFVIVDTLQLIPADPQLILCISLLLEGPRLTLHFPIRPSLLFGRPSLDILIPADPQLTPCIVVVVARPSLDDTSDRLDGWRGRVAKLWS